MRGKNACRAVLIIVGTILIIFGVGFSIFWPDIFQYIFYKQMVLANNTKTFELWKSPPMELYLDIYFFNWTNHEEFANTTSKPQLTEIGPYRFREIPDKDHIVFHPHNSSVSYKKLSNYWFDAKGSNGTLEDTVITQNMIALSASAKARDWNNLKKYGVNMALNGFDQQNFVIKSVDQMLFTGYEDNMIDLAKKMPLFDDAQVPFDRFGWFYTRNGSSELTGFFNIKTGADDIQKLGEMQNWNFEEQLKFFPGECGKIRGSGGEFYAPKQTRDKPVRMFTAEMCRVITMDYKEDLVVEGLTGYKYVGGPRTVDNGTKYPENKCYCTENCAPSGTMDVSACRYGSPVFMSFPHFYNADPIYFDGVEGLNPDRKKHEFSITLEPETGIPLEVNARFQVNVLIRPDEGIDIYNGVPKVYFPMIWFEQRVRIGADMAAEIKMALSIPGYGRIASAVLAVVGAVLLIGVVVSDYLSRSGSRRIADTNDDIKDLKNRVSIDAEGNRVKLPEGSPLINTNILSNIMLANQLDTTKGNNTRKKPKWSPENSTETSCIKH